MSKTNGILLPASKVPKVIKIKDNNKVIFNYNLLLNFEKSKIEYGKKIKNLCINEPAIFSSPKGPAKRLPVASNPKISVPKIN